MKIPQRSKWRNTKWSSKSISRYILVWGKQNTNSKRYMHLYVHFSLKKKEILPFATTWLDMESIMLIEISQRNTVWFQSYMESKKQKERKGKWSRPVMFDSLRPHGLQPARLLCPWDSPGKNTGAGCYFLLQGIFPTQGSNMGLPHYR